jgi:hypothetical protein
VADAQAIGDIVIGGGDDRRYGIEMTVDGDEDRPDGLELRIRHETSDWSGSAQFILPFNRADHTPVTYAVENMARAVRLAADYASTTFC